MNQMASRGIDAKIKPTLHSMAPFYSPKMAELFFNSTMELLCIPNITEMTPSCSPNMSEILLPSCLTMELLCTPNTGEMELSLHTI